MSSSSWSEAEIIKATDKKSKKKKLPINISDLEYDLRLELEADKRYWVQNDAKIRAVTQAGTYENFRLIVEAAHLRPLDKKDKTTLAPGNGKSSRVVWNISASTDSNPTYNENREENSQAIENPSEEAQKNVIPQNIDSFKNIWKSLDEGHKFDYLKLLETRGAFQKLFEIEVPVEIFPQIIKIIQNKLVSNDLELSFNEDYTSSLKVLHSITMSKRFSFLKVFISNDEMIILDNIFENFERKLKDVFQIGEAKGELKSVEVELFNKTSSEEKYDCHYNYESLYNLLNNIKTKFK